MSSGGRGRAAEGGRPFVSARRERVPERIPGALQAAGDRDARRRGHDVPRIHGQTEAGEVMTKAIVAFAVAAVALGASGRLAAQNTAAAEIQILKVQGNI